MSIHMMELVRDASGQWEMCNPQCYGPGSYPEIDLSGVNGGATIVFNIRRQEGPQIPESGFATPVENAIWIQPGTKPNAAIIAPKGQLGTPVLLNDNHTLVLNDKNQDGSELHYQLNFADGTSIDPVIKNGGGGLADTVSALTILLVVVFSVVAGFVGYKLGAR